MYEHCFELSFGEVKRYEEAGESLEGGGLGRRVFVDVRSEEVEEWMYEQRTGIFDYEHRPPGYLWAYRLLS